MRTPFLTLLRRSLGDLWCRLRHASQYQGSGAWLCACGREWNHDCVVTRSWQRDCEALLAAEEAASQACWYESGSEF